MMGSVMTSTSNFLRISLFVLGLLPLSQCLADDKIIKSVHFSEIGAQTRVTLALSESFALDLEEDSAHHKITIKAPGNALWHLKHDEKVEGFVRNYHVRASVLSLEVIPGTDIDDYGLQKNKAGESEFFVDLKNQEQQEIRQEKKEKKASTPVVKKPVMEKEESPQVMRKVGIQKEGCETVLTFETNTPIALDPDLQQAKKKLMIALPKTNWLYVDTKEKQGGVIQGYHVDESCPNTSRMVFSLKSPVDMTVHAPVEHGGLHAYRIRLKASVDANASMIEEEEKLKKKRGRVQTALPEKLPSKSKEFRKKPLIKELPQSGFKLEYKPEPKMEVKEETKKEEVRVPEKEPSVERSIEHKIEEKVPEPVEAEPTSELLADQAQESPQEPSAFTIEGEEDVLDEEELKEDLKGLQISMSLPEEMTYVNKEDLKKDNLKEEKPMLLKKFKIAPSQDVASIASQQSKPQHLPLSNAGSMFTKLQSTQEAQASNEGTAPAWVIEAKMKENQV
jgi:hypothetical protein